LSANLRRRIGTFVLRMRLFVGTALADPAKQMSGERPHDCRDRRDGSSVLGPGHDDAEGDEQEQDDDYRDQELGLSRIRRETHWSARSARRAMTARRFTTSTSVPRRNIATYEPSHSRTTARRSSEEE